MTTSIRDLLPADLRETYDEAQAAEARFDYTGDTDALAAAGQHRQAIVARLRTGTVLFAIVHGLCRVLTKWYRATGDARAIDEAIRGARQVLDAMPENQAHVPLRVGVLTELGNALRARYERTGSGDDFDGARTTYRAVYEIDPSAPASATNLATSYLDGFRRTGQIAELEHAAALMHEALGNTRVGDALGEGTRTANLAGAYVAAWQLTRDPEHLEKAITFSGLALDVLPSGALARAEAASNRAIALVERYQHSVEPDRADLEAALAADNEAVALVPHNPRYRSNRATTLALLNDFTAAIESLREVLHALPAGAPGRAGTLVNLATALFDANDADSARAVLRQAETEAGGLEPAVAVRAASGLGFLARRRGEWVEAAEAFERALLAAGNLFGAEGSTGGTREIWLTGHGEIAAQAARARVAAGDPGAAAVALETGRALQITEALGFDLADLDGLTAAGHSSLAGRFRDAVAWLRDLEVRPDGDHAMLRTARERVTGVVDEIRSQPGFADFLVPPTWASIASAAEDTQLVYLSADVDDGLAIVVLPDGQARSALLPALDLQTLGDHVWGLIGAYEERATEPASWRDRLDTTTRWLWDAVAAPVLELLDGERVTFVPCGLLGALPLHAAWTETAEGRRYLLDDVVVSYTPNARTFLASRRSAGNRADRAVVVVDPPAEGQRRLPGAVAEAASVATHFADVAAVSDSDATADRVLSALSDVDVLHAACHGVADPYQPRDSALLLAGTDRLTVGDLSRRLGSWRLSVLSACETGIPGLALPDEVIGLPAGMLQAGAAGVAASLWAVPDTATALLMTRFYDRWRTAGLDPAAALRQAQLWLRDVTNGEAEAAVDLPDNRYAGPADWRAEWAGARRFEHPVNWAAFCYFGV